MKLDFMEMLYALSLALDMVENEAIKGAKLGHGKRVGYLCYLMGKKAGLDMDEIRDLVGCGILHDNALTEYFKQKYGDLHKYQGSVLDNILDNDANGTGNIQEDSLVKHCIIGERRMKYEYNFKKLDSDEVTRKLGYTKLYDDYHWVISMGVHLDQLDVYIEDAQRKVRPYILAGTAILECILFVSYFILYHIHKCQYIKEKRKLKEEVNFDLLTGAASRRFGQSLLQHRLAKYKSQHYNSLVMMGDIDYFKHVNDFYGHDIGDIALQKFAEAIKSVVQDRDHIIRWGGDEFICVFDYEKEGEEMLIAERLLEAIHQIEIETDKEKVHLTASIGFSLYHESDEFYTDVINRADIALYRAKNSGRDRYEIER